MFLSQNSLKSSICSNFDRFINLSLKSVFSLINLRKFLYCFSYSQKVYFIYSISSNYSSPPRSKNCPKIVLLSLNYFFLGWILFVLGITNFTSQKFNQLPQISRKVVSLIWSKDNWVSGTILFLLSFLSDCSSF